MIIYFNFFWKCLIIISILNIIVQCADKISEQLVQLNGRRDTESCYIYHYKNNTKYLVSHFGIYGGKGYYDGNSLSKDEILIINYIGLLSSSINTCDQCKKKSENFILCVNGSEISIFNDVGKIMIFCTEKCKNITFYETTNIYKDNIKIIK